MSLRPEQYLTALAMSQAGEVVPALEGTYVGGTAGMIAGVLILAIQDIAGLAAREAAEDVRLGRIFEEAAMLGLPLPAALTFAERRAALTPLHAVVEAEGGPAAKALEIRILDHYVETAEAALLVPPQMP